MKRKSSETSSSSLPKPPASGDRAQPLPWHAPKSVDDDPEAAARVRAILESPDFRQADQDIDFLQRDALRPARLQLDYLKTELGLSAHEIAHTVVVFGSTRIPEPDAARRAVEAAAKRLAEDPDDPARRRAHGAAQRILENSRYYLVARDFAAGVSGAPDGDSGGRIAVMTGGGPGLMEAANRGAFHAGGKSVGLNITLPHEQYPNPYLTPGLGFRFHYFALRKLHFLNRARALVAFPGGYGTFDELFETLTLVQTRKIEPLPIILVGREFWTRAVNFPFLVDEGVIDPEDEDLFWYAETAEEIRSHIVEWYRFKGRPLFG
jgi:hypothetical protein